MSTGLGRHPTLAGLVPWSVQYTLPDQQTIGSPGWDIARDWYWGAFAPPTTQIPYAWIAPLAQHRLDKPINVAEVTRTGSGTTRATDADSVADVGEYARPYSIDSIVDDDPSNLAAFAVAYGAGRWRNPGMRIILNAEILTQVDRWTVLERQIGDRIVITGMPHSWPDGVDSLVIEGIRHDISGETRAVIWNTVPVIGEEPGVPGPWFRLDESVLDGDDLIPF